MGFHILQWNCQSVWNKRPELEARSKDYDIIILSETWLEPRSKWLFRNFDTIRSDRGDCRGGVIAIMVRNGIKYQALDNLFNAEGKIEICGINIFFDFKTFSIISLYKPPQVNISISKWHNLFTHLNGEFFIGGDFNLHNTVWGSPSTCPEDQKLLKVCINPKSIDSEWWFAYSLHNNLFTRVSNRPVNF